MTEEERIEADSVAQDMIPSPAPEEPSRFTLWLRRALGWAIAVIVVFGLGAAANWYFQLRPKAALLEQQTTELEAARAELNILRPRAAEADDLQSALGQAQRQMLALQALVHVNDARVAMAQGEASHARLPLLLAEGRLAGLATRTDSAYTETIAAMRERLGLALEELETDGFAAERDLEVVANDLHDLVRQIGAE